MVGVPFYHIGASISTAAGKIEIRQVCIIWGKNSGPAGDEKQNKIQTAW